MKIKTNKWWALGTFFAFALLLGVGYYAFTTSSSTTYAMTEEGYPETFEEFNEQISSVYEKRAELQEKLDTIREYEHVKDYQEIWDVFERYVESEEIGGWTKKGPLWVISKFTYDEDRLNELVATIQKYDPDFQLASSAQDNNIFSSLLNSTITEISIVGYDMLYIGHIDMMLANMQIYFDRNSTHISQRNIASYFVEAANSGFEDRLVTYGRMAELYNRIMSRDSFAEVHAIFQRWQEQYKEDSVKFYIADNVLRYGEIAIAKDNFPYRIRRGPKWAYLDSRAEAGLKDVGVEIENGYTLEQVVKWLPSYEETLQSVGGDDLDHEDLVNFFTMVYESERQNLIETLSVLDPSLTDLDKKTTDELLELSSQIDIDVVFGYLYKDADPKVQTLVKLLIEFNFKALNMFAEYSGDKYLATLLPTANSLMAYAEVEPVDALTAEQIHARISDRSEVYDYYGRIGKAAAAIDPVVIDELYPHEDWPKAVAPGETDDPEDPNADPNRPGSDVSDDPSVSQGSSDGASDRENGGSAPGTGLVGLASTNATTILGIAGVISLSVTAGIKAYRRARK